MRDRRCALCDAELHEREWADHFAACVKIAAVLGAGATDWVDLWSRDEAHARTIARALHMGFESDDGAIEWTPPGSKFDR